MKKIKIVVYGSGHPLKFSKDGVKTQLPDGENIISEDMYNFLNKFIPNKIKFIEEIEIKENENKNIKEEKDKKRGRPSKQ